MASSFLSSLSSEKESPPAAPEVYFPAEQQNGWTAAGFPDKAAFDALYANGSDLPNSIELSAIPGWKIFSWLAELSVVGAISDILCQEQVKVGDSWEKCESDRLQPGMVIKLTEHQPVPADCQIISGTVRLDLRPVFPETNVERSPTSWQIGTPLTHGLISLAPLGAIVLSGEAEAIVLHTGSNTRLAVKIQHHDFTVTAELRQRVPFYFYRLN